MTRTTDRRAAWAIKLVSAQQQLPGVKARTPAPMFRQTTLDGLAAPLLFTTRKEARQHRADYRATFGGAGLRAAVVPVQVTVVEVPTLAHARRNAKGGNDAG